MRVLAVVVLGLLAYVDLSAAQSQDIVCPAENEGNVTFIPNPQDCGSFYVCNHGEPILLQCPIGTHFNAKLKICDLPKNAKCEKNVAVQMDEPEDQAIPEVKCPPKNGVNVTLLPNPKDCSSFFICNHGEAIQALCPHGLHFNAELSVCDYPSQAGCQILPRDMDDDVAESINRKFCASLCFGKGRGLEEESSDM